eukprot:COSAG05_NODE_4388_length_1535_cov_1.107939_1_plen_444_part_10
MSACSRCCAPRARSGSGPVPTTTMITVAAAGRLLLTTLSLALFASPSGVSCTGGLLLPPPPPPPPHTRRAAAAVPAAPPLCGGGAVVVSGRNYMATRKDLQKVATASLAACCNVSHANPVARMFVYTPGVLPEGCENLPPDIAGGCCHVKGGFLRLNLSAQGYFSGVLPNRGPPGPPVPPVPPPPPPPTPPAPPAPPGAKNVLILLADDWRSNLGAALSQPFVITPQMDKFAAGALTFTRAYVQQTVCSPSRNSFMTGRRPEQTKVFNFVDDFRSGRSTGRKGAATERPVGANWTTMPGYFLRRGYHVYGAGKTFQPGRPAHNDGQRSWTEYESGMPGNNSCGGGHVIFRNGQNVSTGEGFAQGWTVIEDCEENDEEAKITAWTVARIHDEATSTELGQNHRPFFIMLGHHRPHLPWHAPRRFFDRLPQIEATAAAAHPELPLG